jgi:uncharacterized protein (DUF2252 family)
LKRQAATRVPELVPIRHGRMLASPLAFFRGAALIMAADLSSTPDTGIRAQICGDAHLANFGAFASPERRMIFEVNDFDETLPGPWEWDIKRLIASLSVAGRNNGFAATDRMSIATAAAAEYRTAMTQFTAMSTLDVWYSHIDVDDTLRKVRKGIGQGEFDQVVRSLTKARSQVSLKAFSKLIRVVRGTPRIAADPPLVVPLLDLYPARQAQGVQRSLLKVLHGYRDMLSSDRRHLFDSYHFVELARKVVGVGSVGTREWILLFLGRDGSDPLVLQAKEAQGSVLEEFAGASAYANHGERVVAGQRLMQAASDIFLGWQRIKEVDGKNHDYYVRQLRDWKWSPEVAALSVPAMSVWGRLCAWTLAHAHARSGDCLAIAAYLGRGNSFDRAMASFAEAYADQNERDYEAFKTAVKAGRLEAVSGV